MATRWLCISALSLILAACGGGGSSDPNNTSGGDTNQPPTSEGTGSGGEAPPSSGGDGDMPSDGASGGGSDSEGGSSGQDGGTDGESSPPGDEENTGDNSFNLDETARFDHPRDLTVDADGNLYVMDTGNEAIRKISSTGEVSTLPAINRSGNISSDPSGNVFLLSHNPIPDEDGRDAMEIHKFTPAGEMTLVRRDEFEPGFAVPSRIATDSQGNLYVLSQYRTRFFVYRIDSTGTYELAYEYSNPTGYVSDFASSPAGDLVLSVHNAVESGPDNTAVYVDHLIVVPHHLQPAQGHQEGVTTRPLEQNTYGGMVNGNMVFEENGDIYLAHTTGTESSITAIRISKIAPDGTTTMLYSGFPDGSSAPRSTTESYKGEVGMVRAENGDFYLSDPYVHAIYRITPSGAVSLVAGKAGEAGDSD